MSAAVPLLEVAGEGCLYLATNGQGTEPLRRDPVARAEAPPAAGWCDTSHLARYVGTDFCQWYGRRSDGRFHPHGKILRITEAGKAALAGKAKGKTDG